MKKYELTDETINIDGIYLYRIRAVRNFIRVEKGELGGFVQCENNLSHKGDCWIFGDAKVYGNSRVYGDAWVSHTVEISGDSSISGNSWVHGDAKLYNKIVR